MYKTKTLKLVVVVCLALSLFCLFQTGKAQVVGSGSIDSDLVCYLRFDDASGVGAADSSGLSNVGAVVDGSWVSGKFVGGLSFNGVNSSVIVADSNSLDQTTALSVSFWIKTTVDTRDVIHKYRGAGTRVWAVYIQGGIIRCGLSNDGTATETFSWAGSVVSGNWVNVAIVFNGTAKTVACYKNGVLVSSQGTVLSSLFVSGQFMEIGGSWLQGFYNGYMDEIRVYNRVLSAAEVSTLCSGVPVSVTYDVGSLVSPNGTVLVGIDQNQSFSIGAQTGYVPWSLYFDGAIQSTASIFQVTGVQQNHTLYVVSQYIGNPSPSNIPYVNHPATDINLFYFLCIFLIIGIPLSILVHPLFGLIFAFIGIFLSVGIINVGYLQTNTVFDSATNTFIYYTQPLGNFVWILVALIVFNFIAMLVALKK